MAEEEKDEAEEKGAEGEEEKSASGKKKGIMLGGGLMGLIGVAYMVAMMAVPSGPPEAIPLAGPFVAALSEDKVQVNLAGEGNKRFLIMDINAIFRAYEEDYITNRVLDPLFSALLQDALIDVASKKSRDQVNNTADRDVFKEEIRIAVDPVLFPIHIGDAAMPYDMDSESGVKTGDSLYSSTLRGLLYEHHITLDTVERLIQLDDGEQVTYRGNETNLAIRNELGETVFLNLTEVVETYQGEIPVGVRGRIQRVAFDSFMVQ